MSRILNLPGVIVWHQLKQCVIVRKIHQTYKNVMHYLILPIFDHFMILVYIWTKHDPRNNINFFKSCTEKCVIWLSTYSVLTLIWVFPKKAKVFLSHHFSNFCGELPFHQSYYCIFFNIKMPLKIKTLPKSRRKCFSRILIVENQLLDQQGHTHHIRPHQNLYQAAPDAIMKIWYCL